MSVANWNQKDSFRSVTVPNMKSAMIAGLSLVLLGLLVPAFGGELVLDPIVKQWLAEMQGTAEPPSTSADTFVTIANGTIRGNTALSVGLPAHNIFQYLGVPYAKPPVGELRFEPPQQFDGWEGTLDASKHPHSCPQYLTNLTEADENCLYLSIYSRRYDNSSGLLPVIFFIHGGGFALGQTSYYTGAKLLHADEVVLVTVQYRLGPLGFLSFGEGDTTVSGNNALKDQNLGLRWVQENIGAFGGDPNDVTVMGESAGSASALYHLLSPMSHGLYNKVVAMSGTPLQEWAIDRNPAEAARRIAKLLNCTGEQPQEIVDCFRAMEWMPLVRASLAVVMEDFSEFKILLVGTTPTIEGNVPGAFLTGDPLDIMENGPLPDVPLMLGTVQHEGMLPLAGAHYLVLNPTGLLNDSVYIRDYLIGDMLKTYGVNEHRDGGSVSRSLAAGYFAEGSSRTDFTAIQYELMDLISAVFMKAPVLRTADILSRRLPAVYLYSFEHYNAINSLYHLAFAIIEPILGGEKPDIRPGTMHADDLIYMFTFPFSLNTQDTTFSRKYCKLFTNFARYGNPTPEGFEEWPMWPKYDIENQYYMKMSLFPEAKRDYAGSWRQGMLP